MIEFYIINYNKKIYNFNNLEKIKILYNHL